MWDCNQLLTGGAICIGPQLTKIIQYSIDQPSHIRVESQRSVMSWEFRPNILKKNMTRAMSLLAVDCASGTSMSQKVCNLLSLWSP